MASKKPLERFRSSYTWGWPGQTAAEPHYPECRLGFLHHLSSRPLYFLLYFWKLKLGHIVWQVQMSCQRQEERICEIGAFSKALCMWSISTTCLLCVDSPHISVQCFDMTHLFSLPTLWVHCLPPSSPLCLSWTSLHTVMHTCSSVCVHVCVGVSKRMRSDFSDFRSLINFQYFTQSLLFCRFVFCNIFTNVHPALFEYFQRQKTQLLMWLSDSLMSNES